MEIRSAVPGDDSAIADVHIRPWQDGYRGQLPQDVRARRFYEATGRRTDGAVNADQIAGARLPEVRYNRVLGSRGR